MEEIRFFLTREDFWHFKLYGLFHQRRILLAYILIFIGVGIVCLSVINSFPLSIIIFLLLVILFITLLFRRVRINASKAAQGAVKRGEIILAISAQGVWQRSELGDSMTSWRAIKAIKQDKYNFYFILDSPGSNVLLALLIPKRAFDGPQEGQRFLEQAQSYWREQSGQTIEVR
jgi:membrane protein implicated in regulation of membrane protease activity